MKTGRIAAFLVLTFGLSWGYDALLTALAGADAFHSLGMPPWGMFVPAAVAIFFRLFSSEDHPLRTAGGTARWIPLSFLLLTALYALLPALALLLPSQARLMAGLGTLFISLWTLIVISLAAQSGGKPMERMGLGLGDVAAGQRLVLAAAGYFLLSAALNLVFDLGSLQAMQERVYELPVPDGLYIPALALLFGAVTVIGGPLSGIASTFGEEYGWRGFLLDELDPLGGRAAATLTGLIWGAWHLPVILRGVHTYPPTAMGILAGLLFFTLWGVLQAYAVRRSGSIWTAAFLHGVVNSVYAFSLIYLVRPDELLWSFGLGWFGLGVLAVLAVLALRSPAFSSASRSSF